MRSLSLRVLSVTDLHGAVMPYDYFSDTPDDSQGLVRTASLIHAARAEAENTVLLDSGDFLQGSPMGDVWVAEPERLETGVVPIIDAMNHVGVEAATVGNHDFNYGLEFLRGCLGGARFPVVCANVVDAPKAASPADDATMLAPYTILNRTMHDAMGQPVALKLGIIGTCPPQIMAWDRRLLCGRVDTRDMVEAMEHWVPRLRAEGVDLVIALCHAGIDDRPHTPEMEQVAAHVAAVDGIDVVLAGHQHTVFPSARFERSDRVDPQAATLAGKPAVMVGYNGSHLGVVDLDLQQGSTGWQVKDHTVAVRPILGADGNPTVGDEPGLKAHMTRAHTETRAYVARPIARTSSLITTYFAPVASTPALDVVAAAQAEFVKHQMADSVYADLPLVSLTAPFKAGGFGGPDYYTRIEPGSVRIGDVIDLYLYPNGATALCLTTGELRDWLDRAAGMFRQVPPGSQDAVLLNEAFQTYNFDVLYGLSYAIDLSVPSVFDDQGVRRAGAHSRIRDLALNGQPVAEDQRFLVATNGFRAGGGGGYPIDGNGMRVGDWPVSVRDVLMERVSGCDDLASASPAQWRFAAAPGTSVVLPTHPRADDDLPELATGRPERLGMRADGFAEYRIQL